MKKICMFALALLILCAAAASAEYSVARTVELEAMSINSGTSTFAALVDDGYYLYNNQVEALAGPYDYMYELEDDYYDVASGKGVNCHGVVDGSGQLVIPLQYGDIAYISDSWMAGIVLSEATKDEYDYEDFSDNYYIIDHYDVYFDGEMIGSLGRKEFGTYGEDYGDYLRVVNKDNDAIYYDKTLAPSPYDGSYYGEYDEDYSSGKVYHIGSGQEAFTASCTLTSDQVKYDMYNKNGIFYDLQGNELFRTNYSRINDFEYGYAIVEFDAFEGMIDTQGNEVIPCKFDDFNYRTEMLAKCGCISASLDGKFCFVKADGTVSYQSPYSYDVVDINYAPIACVQDLDGSYRVLTAYGGELETHYSDINMPYDCGTPFCTVVDQDGNVGAVDCYGSIIVPLDGTYTSTYDLDYVSDGSVIIGEADYGKCIIYIIESSETEPAAPVEETLVEEAAPVEEAPASEDWTCESCGTTNSGKFCSECGAQKPAGNWICPDCGTENSGKFCTECGRGRG